jgi:hypothetical protein
MDSMASSLGQGWSHQIVAGMRHSFGETRGVGLLLAVMPGRYNLVVAASIEELSYQLTADALAEQERTLNALRTRAGTVVAVASISGSFLGAKVNHGSLDVWAILALIAFVLCLAAAIWVLLPHRLVFAFRGEALLAESDHQGVGGRRRGLPRGRDLDRAAP